MPIRLIAMMGAPPAGRLPVKRMIGMLTVDQTTWAIVTYLVFRIALGARRRGLRQVLTVLALLAVPLMMLREWVTATVSHALGLPTRSSMGALLFTARYTFSC
jgi:hypothetical protein